MSKSKRAKQVAREIKAEQRTAPQPRVGAGDQAISVSRPSMSRRLSSGQGVRRVGGRGV